MPIKSTPAYMQNPKAHNVAIAALKLPKRPNHGLDLTQSNIIHVTAKENFVSIDSLNNN